MMKIIENLNEIDDEVLLKVTEGITEKYQEEQVHVEKIVKTYAQVEDIYDDYDGLFFFNTELQPNPEAIGGITEGNTDAIYGFQKEMHFVNKFLTIQRYYSQRGDFYKQRFMDVVTSDKTEKDNLGIIEKYGSYMSVEEFKLFREAFNELFKME